LASHSDAKTADIFSLHALFRLRRNAIPAQNAAIAAEDFHTFGWNKNISQLLLPVIPMERSDEEPPSILLLAK
jgi:hypothetical protein